jgi:hypothetical protein
VFGKEGQRHHEPVVSRLSRLPRAGLPPRHHALRQSWGGTETRGPHTEWGPDLPVSPGSMNCRRGQVAPVCPVDRGVSDLDDGGGGGVWCVGVCRVGNNKSHPRQTREDVVVVVAEVNSRQNVVWGLRFIRHGEISISDTFRGLQGRLGRSARSQPCACPKTQKEEEEAAVEKRLGGDESPGRICAITVSESIGFIL